MLDAQFLSAVADLVVLFVWTVIVSQNFEEESQTLRQYTVQNVARPVYICCVQEVLYMHEVNHISFISRDTGDSRAFGYIYQRKDGLRQFFGIKTEKAVGLTFRRIF